MPRQWHRSAYRRALRHYRYGPGVLKLDWMLDGHFPGAPECARAATAHVVCTCLAQFALTARDETDLARLTDELLRVVDTTVQPEFAGVWLREPNRGTPKQSTPNASRS